MYLLDTHTLLWAFYRKNMLSNKVTDIIHYTDDLYVSIASFWEISIKQGLHKLEFRQSAVDLENECIRQNIEVIPIRPIHCDRLRELPPIHSDPFDRLIVAQANSENLTIITKDRLIQKYPIETIW